MAAPEIKQAYLFSYGPPPETMYFTSMPKITNHGASSNYETSDALGVSGLAYMWKNTGPQSITVETKFVAYDSAKDDVVRRVNWCLSLVYPLKTINEASQTLNRPPVVYLSVGDWFSFVGIVKDVSIVYGESYAVNYISAGIIADLSPLEATVTLNMERVRCPGPAGTSGGLFNLGYIDVSHQEVKQYGY